MDTLVGVENDLDITLSRKRDGIEGYRRGRVAQQVNLIEHSPSLNASIRPLKEQEKKRPRRNEGGEDGSNSSNTKSALSFEEGDRAK